MKKLLILFSTFSIILGCSEPKDTSNQSNLTTFTSSSSMSNKAQAYAYTGRKYKIIKGKTSYSDYEILIDPVDLNSTEYKKDIQGIIDDVAHSYKSDFTAYFYDDPKAADLNYADLELGKQLTKTENDLVNNHIVAIFGKDVDGTVRVNYFENVPEEKRNKHKAWKEAFDESEFNSGYKPNAR